MRGRQSQVELLFEECRAFQSRAQARFIEDGQVHFALEQQLSQGRRALLAQAHGHPRMAAGESLEHGRQQEGAGGGHAAQGHLALLEAGQIVQFAPAQGQGLQGFARARQKSPAPAREPRGLAPPFKERAAQLLFQLLQLDGERRLRHRAGRRGPGKAALFGHGQEIAQLMQFHTASLYSF
jgi:hypothetical protein